MDLGARSRSVRGAACTLTTSRLLSVSRSSRRVARRRLMSVNDKRTIYVGGLEESVSEATLRAAFL